MMSILCLHRGRDSESRWIENPMFAPEGVLSEAVSHAQPSQVRTPGFQMPPLPKSCKRCQAQPLTGWE